MFPYMSVHHSVCPWGESLPMAHWNSLYRAPPWPQPPGHGTSGTFTLAMTLVPWTWDLKGPLNMAPVPPPASDIWWPSLETCSSLFTFPTRADIWWLFKQVWSVQVGSTDPTRMLSRWLCDCIISMCFHPVLSHKLQWKTLNNKSNNKRYNRKDGSLFKILNENEP